MPWLILPPQPDGKEDLRVFLGRSTTWPSPDALRMFSGAMARGIAGPLNQLPPTRNPDVAFESIALPEVFPIGRSSSASAVTNFDPIEDMPDVVFGAGYSWFVNAKVKSLLKEVAPGATRFEPTARRPSCGSA